MSDSFIRDRYTKNNCTGKKEFDGMETICSDNYDTTEYLDLKFAHLEENDKHKTKIAVIFQKNKLKETDKTSVVYNEETYAATNPMAAQGRNDKKIISLSFISKHINKTNNGIRHYVNIDGSTVGVKAHTDNLKNGDKVYWRITADSNNSKRDFPKPFDGKIQSIVTDNTTEINFECGLAGGDKFIIEAGLKDEKYVVKTTLVNWRKLWYQISHLKSVTLPSIDEVKTSLSQGFIELIETKTVSFDASDFPVNSGVIHKRKNVICNEELFSCKDIGPEEDIVIVNQSNLPYLEKLFHKKNDQHIHIIVCNEQYDFIERIQENSCQHPEYRDDFKNCKGCPQANICDPYYEDTSLIVNNLEGYVDLNYGAIKNNSKGHVLVPKSSYVSKWYVCDHRGRTVDRQYFTKYMQEPIPGPYQGEIDENTITISETRDSNKSVMVNLPEEAQKFLLANDILDENLYVIKLDLKYNSISEEFLGFAESYNSVIRYDQNNNNEFFSTITHEIGHTLGLVPEGVNPILKEKHSHQYIYLGSHCNNIVKPSTDYCVMKTGRPDGNDENTENMTGKTSVRFCEECLKFLKSFDIKKLTLT